VFTILCKNCLLTAIITNAIANDSTSHRRANELAPLLTHILLFVFIEFSKAAITIGMQMTGKRGEMGAEMLAFGVGV
jgi:hypothetical protein